MAIEDLKGKLHSLIDATSNQALIEDLLVEAENRINTNKASEAEGLSDEDFEELVSLAKEAHEKDIISYNELKSSLSRWFTK